jgi:NAD(P)-dependent dehydrogenase (short-subunit alcohol dehydrogenase family)
MGWLDAQTALVTGGGRGIGEAIARRLAREGASVLVAGRSLEELQAVAQAVGGRALVADLADRAGVQALAREVGAVDVLVNNAGVAESAPLAETSDAVWDRALAVNVSACFVLCRALVPGMVARGRGRVVNIASNAGLTGYAYTSAYCASKHALVGLTRALAMELGRTAVTINAVCPGWVNTRMTDQAIERIARTTGRDASNARKALEAMSPQRRLLEPEEVAEAVAYLCHPDARGVHGQALALDGGQVLG